MTLKFKRNLPLVLLLTGILSILALTMGSQRIVSYTVTTETIQTWQTAVSQFDFSSLLSQPEAAQSAITTLGEY